MVAIVGLAALSCGGGDTTGDDAAGTPEPQQNVVEVGLTEFAFGMSAEEITGGNVTFEFTNQGDAHHEVGFWRVEEGTTIQDIERALNQGGPPKGADDLSGIPVLSPGYSTAMARDLEPGTYGFVCMLPVAGEKGYTPHAAEGMVTLFDVEGTSGASAPAPEYTVTVTDDAFDVQEIEAGDHWVELVNGGTKTHEFALFSPEEGNALEDIDRWFGTGQKGPAPAVFPGGLQSIPPGDAISLRITFEEGRTYVFQDFENEIETEFEVGSG
ncbi:MAG TPA: hypothetical protein VJ927_12370 [Actinomycetota bacterium]|nr:hypothetical protein [Actinomycetota bacterium]